MTHFIVTADQSDRLLVLEALREIEQEIDFDILVANGKRDIQSFARSLSLFENASVLAVMDADTTDPDLTREQQLAFNDLVTSVALTAPLELALAVPTLKDIVGTEEFHDQLRLFSKWTT